MYIIAIGLPDDFDRSRLGVSTAVGAATGRDNGEGTEEESGEADEEAGEDQDRGFARRGRGRGTRVEEFGRGGHRLDGVCFS